MRVLTIISFILLSLFVQAVDVSPCSIYKVLWNDHNNTLSLVLKGDKYSIDYLYCHADELNLRFDGEQPWDFEMSSLSKGLGALGGGMQILPKKTLILLDVGASDYPYISIYLDAVREITASNRSENQMNLMLFADELSSPQCISALHNDLRQITNKAEVDFGSESDYVKLFQFVRSTGRDYEKIFFLSTFLGQPYLKAPQIYDRLLSREAIRQAQLIPLSVQGMAYNEPFYEFLETVSNILPIRDHRYVVPDDDLPSFDPYFDQEQLSLSFRLKEVSGRGLLASAFLLQLADDPRFQFRGSLVSQEIFDPALVRRNMPVSSVALSIFLVAGVLGFLLYFGIPLYNRFVLKRDHVFAYADLQEEGVHAVDPLKLSRINAEDKVVRFGEKVMLLDSWKYIKKNMADQASSSQYQPFFEQPIEGNIFTIKKGPFRYLLPVFVSMLLAFGFAMIHLLLFRQVMFNWPLVEVRAFNSSWGLQNIAMLPLAFHLVSILVSAYMMKVILSRRVIPKHRVLLRTIWLISSALIIVPLVIIYLLPIIDSPVVRSTMVFLLGAVVLELLLGRRNEWLKTFSNIFNYSLFLWISFWFLRRNLFGSSQDDTFSFFWALFLFLLILALSWYVHSGAAKSFRLEIMNGQDLSIKYLDFMKKISRAEESKFLIGRNPNADLYVKWDGSVAQDHAFIAQSEEEFYVHAVEGRVLVNDEEISESRILRPYDEIKLGENNLTLLRLVEV